MVTVKSPAEINAMREAAAVLKDTFSLLDNYIKEGVTTRELDRVVADYFKRRGAKACCKGYNGYPATICTSVGFELIHGIPSARRLFEGEIVSIDISLSYKGFHSDATRTYAIGQISEEAARLVRVTEEAFFRGIEVLHGGVRLGTLGHAIQRHAEQNGYSVARDFVGHGIGRNLHEDPSVPNWGREGSGIRLPAGMTLAIEPMICAGAPEVEILSDGWTVVSKDRQLTAHYENTVLITENGAEILTL